MFMENRAFWFGQPHRFGRTNGGRQRTGRLVVSAMALAALMGCSTPDVSTELQAATLAFGTLKTATRPDLETEAEGEFNRAEEVLIRSKQQVVETIGVCQSAGALATIKADKPLEPCRLSNKVNVISGTINASQVIAMETAIEVYLASLAALADATSVTEIRAQTEKLVLAIGGLSGLHSSPGLNQLAVRATSEKDRITGAVGLIVNQFRHQALKNAVHRGERQIQKAARTLYGYYQTRNPAPTEAALALSNAEKIMIEARLSGTVSQYRKSVEAFRTAFAKFDAAQKKAPANWYRAFAQAHSALHQRLQSGGSIDDLITTIDQLIALKPES